MTTTIELIVVIIISCYCLISCEQSSTDRDIWDNWSDIVSEYKIQKLSADLFTEPIVVIGGCTLSGIDRIANFVRNSDYLVGIELGSYHWNLTTHVER